MILTSNFRYAKNPPREREVFIPGFEEPVRLKLNTLPVEIIQSGLADVSQDSLDELRFGLQQVDAADTLDALNLGTFASMYKHTLHMWNEQTCDGGRIAYEILWRQKIPNEEEPEPSPSPR